tara:strand:+ start:3128 stop:4996 length:1869 start_codon:yes stop_codon:yes gene_type:complete
MAFVVNDRVKETTTSTGTGTINLAGAETGFETFVAGIGNSNTTYYCIQAQGGSAFEIGVGTVTDASPDTLSRTAIISSSNSDAVVDFAAGTKDVFCTLPASKAVIEDSSTNADIAGNLTIGGTVDGVDIAARDAVLTSTTTTATNANTTANAALPKAGGTMTGNIVMSGSETVDGVDISARDAVLTSTTTTATNAETTANAALPKAGGTMTGDIAHASDFTLDVGGDLILDADGGDIKLRDGGSGFGQLQNSSSDFVIQVDTQDKDIVFKGDDGGSAITALTLDMSSEGSLVVNSNVKYPDNGKAIFGAGSDLQIYHDSNNSIIADTGTGGLQLLSSEFKVMNSAGDENQIIATENAGVDLYFNNILTAKTTGNGLEIPADNLELRIGASADLTLYHDGNDSYINEGGTGTLIIRGSTAVRITNVGGDNMFKGTDGGAAELYYAGTKMAETVASGFKVADDKRLEIGNGTNWSGELAGKIEHHSDSMYHQFTTSWIARNASGSNMLTVDSSGNGTFNANVTAYSDYRIKEDIKTIDNALDKVSKLRGVEYTRKETKAREIGVIAQEVKEIVPELVAIENLKSDMNPDALEDMHTMKYQNTVGLLIEAIKDLKAEIETLKKDK